MKFHVLTLFPDMVMQGLMTSITGRAVQQKKIDIDAVNIRDYSRISMAGWMIILTAAVQGCSCRHSGI